MYDVRWLDVKGGELIVRKFQGKLLAENADSITITYRKKPLVLQKANCSVSVWKGGRWVSA